MNFGNGAFGCDEETSTTIIHAYLDAGHNFIDTANVYSETRSETIVGKAVKGRRDSVVIATKGASPLGPGPFEGGTSRKTIMKAAEDSLRRLDTDYIDLFQVHVPDPRTPIEETLRTLDDIVKSGKVRYIGNSNFFGWQVVEADWIARTEHLTRFISAQNEYNLLQRNIETELAPAITKYGLGLLPYFPLASGFLTGKYRPNEAPPEGTRLGNPNSPFGRVLNEGNFDMLMKLEKFAEERGHTMVELAFSWLASKPYVGSVIAGATKPEQVEVNANAASWKLTDEEFAEVDEIMGRAPVGPGGRMTPRPATR
jgi:aryl-alcohol dehydrogenase-like predicted oxidoreductase